MTDAGLTSSVADAAAGSEVTPTEPTTTPQGSEQSSGINPAWSPMLEALPTQLHHLVTPHLTQWDKNFQTEVQKAQQAYEPWKPLAESGISPEIAHGILNLMNTNPQALVENMINYYGLDLGQGQQNPEGTPNSPLDVLDLDQIQDPNAQQQFDITQHPQFQQLQLQVQQFQDYFAQQEQQKIQERANAEIDAEIAEIKKAHPDVDEKALIMFAANTPGIENMQQAYDSMVAYNQQVLQSRPTLGAPPVLAPGGGTPAAPTADVAHMDRKDTRNLVAQLLEARAAQT